MALISKSPATCNPKFPKLSILRHDGRGQHYIATPFTFGDGDQPVVVLAPNQDGWMLSDRGTTLFRLGFQLNDAEYSAPENRVGWTARWLWPASANTTAS